MKDVEDTRFESLVVRQSGLGMCLLADHTSTKQNKPNTDDKPFIYQMPTRPMLAAKVNDLNEINLPVLATPKIDGIRAMINEGRGKTRTWKSIPNRHIQSKLNLLPDGLDGELVIPDANFNETQSAVMSVDGRPNFLYRIFDYVPALNDHVPFIERWCGLKSIQHELERHSYVSVLNQCVCQTVEQLEQFELECLTNGHEGMCTRSPTGMYKSGRSTPREQFLLKIKRFSEAEAEVVGFVELFHNENEATTDAFGLTKRSKAQDGLVGAGILGALQVRCLRTGVQFEIGTGFTFAQRHQIWQNRTNHLYSVVTYKYQPYGMKDRPRCPVFRGFRLDI